MMARPVSSYLVTFGGNRRRPPPNLTIADLPENDPEPLIEAPDFVEAARIAARAEGEEAARFDYERKLAAHEETFRRQLSEAREAWLQEQGGRLSAELSNGLAALETQIADCVDRILRPFLETTLRRNVVDELVGNVGLLLKGDKASSLRLSGPADLVAALREKMPEADAVAVDWHVDEKQCEVQILSDDTRIESCLQPWRAYLDALDS